MLTIEAHPGRTLIPGLGELAIAPDIRVIFQGQPFPFRLGGQIRMLEQIRQLRLRFLIYDFGEGELLKDLLGQLKKVPPQAWWSESELTGYLIMGVPVYVHAGGLYTFQDMNGVGQPLHPAAYWLIMLKLLDDEEFLARTKQL